MMNNIIINFTGKELPGTLAKELKTLGCIRTIRPKYRSDDGKIREISTSMIYAYSSVVADYLADLVEKDILDETDFVVYPAELEEHMKFYLNMLIKYTKTGFSPIAVGEEAYNPNMKPLNRRGEYAIHI